jgi:hypothetical protein
MFGVLIAQLGFEFTGEPTAVGNNKGVPSRNDLEQV